MSRVPEVMEAINKSLRDLYGTDIVTGLPIWRVVWSEDQKEKRYGEWNDFTPSGIFLKRVTETREVPKYANYAKDVHILERLVLVPEENRLEMCGVKLSYEPLWTFYDKFNKPIIPNALACKFVIDTVLAAQTYNSQIIEPGQQKVRANPARNIDPEVGNTREEAQELKKKRIDEITNQLFGDETGLLGSTIDGESIIVPRNYEKDMQK